jgi:hypothetical protein
MSCDRENDVIEGIDTSGLTEKIQRTLRLYDVVQTSAVKLAHYYVDILKARTPKKTGVTQDSWTVHFHVVDGNTVVWAISPDGREKEVTFLEFGTKPHVIEPSVKEALKFEVEGEVVFAKKVFHPGTKPLGLVRLTQEDLNKEAGELAQRLLKDLRNLWA